MLNDTVPLRNMLLTRKIISKYTYLKENSLEGTAEKQQCMEPQKHWQAADTYCIDAVAMSNQRSFKIGSFRFAAFVPKKIEYNSFWN